jgi:hypothetical protein
MSGVTHQAGKIEDSLKIIYCKTAKTFFFKSEWEFIRQLIFDNMNRTAIKGVSLYFYLCLSVKFNWDSLLS